LNYTRAAKKRWPITENISAAKHYQARIGAWQVGTL